MKSTKLSKNFVSDIDKFFEEFDSKHPEPSDSQRAEQLKYERIFRLRDDPNAEDHVTKVWEKF